MSPFREPPAVELGPLEVGLGRAARRAMIGMIPSGGRLLAAEDEGPHGAPSRRAHAAGALGSLGLLLVGACAFVLATAGLEPRSGVGATAVMALVIAGGLSLATVLRALDAPRERLTLRGDVVGRAARRALRRAQRLAAHAARAPERFGPRRVAALRKTLRMLADPLVADWIPSDVRGRVELLLARAEAATAGARWSRDARLQADVRALLVAAAEHLADPEPARSDLLALTAGVDPQPPDGRALRARIAAALPSARSEDAGDGEGVLACEAEALEASVEEAVRGTVRR